jgi:putative integrase
MIDTLMTVTLRRAKQGKKGFDPESVEIVWK